METKIIRLKTPLSRADISDLEIGDVVELSGFIYTARDAAHKRMENAWKQGLPLPLDLKGQLVFYAGPCPAKPGHAVGSIAPTTSMRMDGFVEMTFELGVIGMIGKGDRSDFVPGLCKKYGGVYFLGTGGASALISKQVKNCETAAWEDLGTESVKKLEVENLRLIVGIDSNGRVFQDREIPKYRR
jgi:fumarate hydratase subunit beta